MPSFKKILMPTDYSPSAERALVYAANLARDLGARLLVTHVVPPYDPLYFDHVKAWPAAGTEAEKKERQKLADRIRKSLGRKQIRYQTELSWGDPPERIVAMAADRACDLIVLGRKGRAGWNTLVMGSVADKVVRHAPCPVLTVAPPDRPHAAAASRVARRRREPAGKQQPRGKSKASSPQKG